MKKEDLNMHIASTHLQNGTEKSERKRKAVELRPAMRQKIYFKLYEEDIWKYGKVIRVGKAKGRDKNACWVLDKNNVESKINFATEVEDWKYVTVKFSDDTQNNNTSNNIYFNNSFFTELKLLFQKHVIWNQKLLKLKNWSWKNGNISKHMKLFQMKDKIA